jgi:hypothetical protein
LAIVQISQITNRKGLAIDLPQLAGAELGWSTDTRQLWIGNGTLQDGAPVVGNTEILTEFSDIINIATAYTYKGTAAGYVVQTGPTANDPVSLSLQNWLDQYASVLDFGATGDGVTDDTAAINRALYQIYCREVNPQIRRSIFFPAGVYRITSPLLIPPYATLIGEGENNSIIRLDDATGELCVAQSADSLQQIGNNIGNGGAITPQSVTIANMGFESLDATVSIFLVQDAKNYRFQNVGFNGPLTTSDLSTDALATSGIEFLSTPSLVCNGIVFDGCQFSGTVWGVASDQQIKGITVSNSMFNILYQGVALGIGSPVLGGPTGFRVVQNRFDNIFAEGIVFGQVSLNASGYNIFYDVGNNFLGTTQPYTACINIYQSNNVSIGDMFERSDAYAGSTTPGVAYPRITLNDTQSIAFTNGAQLALGTYTRESGVITTLNDNVAILNTIFSINTATAVAFSVNYTITRNGAYSTGTIVVAAESGPNPLNWSIDYVENADTGVGFSVIQTGTTIDVMYSTTSTGYSAQMDYTITYLA